MLSMTITTRYMQGSPFVMATFSDIVLSYFFVLPVTNETCLPHKFVNLLALFLSKKSVLQIIENVT